MTAIVRDENLDFWIKNGYNVLFIGAHGVGKTSIVRDAFNRHKLSWKYFSAATMDPWVDFVGVPRERQDPDGEPYLDLLRVQGLEHVEALFFDELNRAPKKVRNAVMELIQFRTINGKPFKKLKTIWAAINPEDDDTYDVEKLDPAQADRFHVKVSVPYKPDKEYFTAKYGQKMARAAISWWTEMPEEIRMRVSPRRLDYALDIYNKNGDIRFALPDQCNVAKLLTTLRHGPVHDTLQKLQADGNLAVATDFLSNENNYQAAIAYVKKSPEMMGFFFPLLSTEKLSVLASETGPLRYMLDNITEQQKYADCISDIYRTSTNKKAVQEIGKVSKTSSDVAAVIGQTSVSAGGYQIGKKVEPPYFPKRPTQTPDYYRNRIKELVNESKQHAINGRYMNTIDRKKIHMEVIGMIPSKLSVEEALDTLQCINGIAKRSHSQTLEKLPHIMGVVNHCFAQIADFTGQSLEKIVNSHKEKRFGTLWRMIRTDYTLSAKLATFGAKSTSVTEELAKQLPGLV